MEPSSFSVNPDFISAPTTTNNNVSSGKVPHQSSYEGSSGSLFSRKKMSQAEKQRGWVKMRNVSAVKISIQVAGAGSQ